MHALELPPSPSRVLGGAWHEGLTGLDLDGVLPEGGAVYRGVADCLRNNMALTHSHPGLSQEGHGS